MCYKKMDGRCRFAPAKKKLAYKYNISMAVLLVVLLLASSCGQARNFEEDINSLNGTDAYTVHTIDLVFPYRFNNPNHRYINHTAAFNTAARRLDRHMREGGERFQLNVIRVPWFGTDAIHYVQRKELRMMAGQPYDVFLVDKHLHNVWRYAQNGFLADVYALIDESPNAVRDDFFTNALDAFTIGGNLYTFPLNFRVDLVGINANAPQKIIDEFSMKTTVTIPELMAMYMACTAHHMYIFCTLLIPQRDFFPRLTSYFVDLSGLTSNVNQNSFIDVLSMFQKIQLRNGFVGHTLRWTITNSLSFIHIEKSQSSMFTSHSYRMYPLLAFFEPHLPSFVNVVPVTNAIGELNIRTRYNFAITNTSQAPLAWEFLNQLINPLLSLYGNVGSCTTLWNPSLLPIKRKYAEQHVSSTLGLIEFRFLQREGRHEDVLIIPDTETRAEIYKTITETFLTWAEMPMAPVPMATFNFLQDDIDQLLHGILTPQEAAQRMHNRVVLWLIE